MAKLPEKMRTPIDWVNHQSAALTLNTPANAENMRNEISNETNDQRSLSDRRVRERALSNGRTTLIIFEESKLNTFRFK